MGIGVISWIVVGILAGVVAWVLPKISDPIKIISIECVGIAGAFMGGFLCVVNGIGHTESLNIFTMLAAALFAALALFLHHVGSAVIED